MNIGGIVEAISSFFVGVSTAALTIIGLHSTSPTPFPSPLPTPEIAQVEITASPIATTSASPSASVVATMSAKPSPSPNPSPSPVVDLDLNLEAVRLLPKNIRDAEYEDSSGGDPIARLFDGSRDGKLLKVKQKAELRVIPQIRNNGHEDANEVVVKVIADGETLMTFTIDRIEKQSVKNETRDISIPKGPGKHLLEIQVNPDKTMAEARFDNNTKIIEYEMVN